jgi:hypothetical protein
MIRHCEERVTQARDIAPQSPSSFRDAPLGAGPESITTIVSMDSGLVLRTPRNDERMECDAQENLPDGQISFCCPALARKIFRLTRRANQRYQLARLTRQEGRLAIVTNVRWDAVDADVLLTNGT